MITPFHKSYSVFKARVLAVMKYNWHWQPFWSWVEPGRRGSKVGAHPGKGNRWWERCQRFVLCTTSTSTYYYYRLLSYGQPIDHPQERSEVEGRTTYKRLVIRRWELRDTSPLVSNLNITQAAKMSMGPYSLARVLQRGMVDPWCTSTTPLWEKQPKTIVRFAILASHGWPNRGQGVADELLANQLVPVLGSTIDQVLCLHQKMLWMRAGNIPVQDFAFDAILPNPVDN